MKSVIGAEHKAVEWAESDMELCLLTQITQLYKRVTVMTMKMLLSVPYTAGFVPRTPDSPSAQTAALPIWSCRLCC